MQMNRVSWWLLAILGMSACLIACSGDSVDEVNDGLSKVWPAVEGLPVATDLNPADDIVEYQLTIGVEEVELLEGYTTQVWTYNGTTPGPLLQATVGDRVIVHVRNNLAEPTTVHWHGLRIPVEMDGVVHGSVQAIWPGQTFTYEFTVPDSGTYWYHPHVRSYVQIEAGLYGAFVVHERDEARPQVSADRMLVLDDIRLEEDGSISQTITGHDVMMGRSGNVLLLNGKSAELSVPMAPGGVERWRLVNTANARTMVLRFEGLKVREIGADGGLWPQRDTRYLNEVRLPVGARAELEVQYAADDGSPGYMNSMVLALDENNEVVEIPVRMVVVS